MTQQAFDTSNLLDEPAARRTLECYNHHVEHGDVRTFVDYANLVNDPDLQVPLAIGSLVARHGQVSAHNPDAFELTARWQGWRFRATTEHSEAYRGASLDIRRRQLLIGPLLRQLAVVSETEPTSAFALEQTAQGSTTYSLGFTPHHQLRGKRTTELRHDHGCSRDLEGFLRISHTLVGALLDITEPK